MPTDDHVWKSRAAVAGAIWLGPTVQHALMPALGATPFFLPDEDGDDGVVFQIFIRGPFRLGYIGFPIGQTLQGRAIGMARIKRLLGSVNGRRIQVLRVISSAFNPDEPLSTHVENIPETTLINLQDFDISAHKNLRRDVKHAKKRGVKVRLAEAQDADLLYATYAQNVIAHGSSPKYTPAYFSSLIKVSLTESRIKLYVAVIDERFAGFLVALFERDTGYYLHSAVMHEYRQAGATDLLMATALADARNLGLRSFNHMASPNSQPGLVKFKEKWGGVSSRQSVYEIRPRPMAAFFLRSGAHLLSIQSKFRRAD